MTTYTGSVIVSGSADDSLGDHIAFSGQLGVTLNATLDRLGNGSASESIHGSLTYFAQSSSGTQLSGTIPLNASYPSVPFNLGSFSVSQTGTVPVSGLAFGVNVSGNATITRTDVSESLFISIIGNAYGVHINGEVNGSGTLHASVLPAVYTSAANLPGQLNGFEASAHSSTLKPILLTDPGTPTVTITPQQLVSDIDALRFIGDSVTVALPTAGVLSTGASVRSLGLASTHVGEVQFVDGSLVFDSTAPAAQIYRLYQAAFNRTPDPDGLAYWTGQLQQGMSLHSIANLFLSSPEFPNVGSTTDFVTLLYSDVLHRVPDPAGLNYWVAQLNVGGQDRAQVLIGFSESAENKGNTSAAVTSGIWVPNGSAASVARLYYSVLDRAPDAGGLAYWSSLLASGADSLQTEAAQFMASPEFSPYANLSASDFVSRLYSNVLHRSADPDGLSYWSAQINSGVSRASVVVGFSESAEHQGITASAIDGGIVLGT